MDTNRNNRLNIIVVEDNDELREATIDALELEGHTVCGLDCAEALPEESSWQSIDLMVIDLHLPGEDGLALTRRIRAIQPDIGIVMVTARNLPTDKQLGYASGADIYITKPASLEELASAIQALSRRIKSNATPQGLVAPTLYQARHCLCASDCKDVILSPQEVTLLVALNRAAGNRLETWQLIQILDKHDAEAPKAAVEILITRLRKKLQQGGYSNLNIKSIRNWGYQLSGMLRMAS